MILILLYQFLCYNVNTFIKGENSIMAEESSTIEKLRENVLNLWDEFMRIHKTNQDLEKQTISLMEQIKSPVKQKYSLILEINLLMKQTNSLMEQVYDFIQINNSIIINKNLPESLSSYLLSKDEKELKLLKKDITDLFSNENSINKLYNQIINLYNQQIDLLQTIIVDQCIFPSISQKLQNPNYAQNTQTQPQIPEQRSQNPNALTLEEIISQNKGGAYTANNCFYYSLFAFLQPNDINMLVESYTSKKQDIINFAKNYIDDIIQNHTDIKIEDIPSLTLVCIMRYVHLELIQKPIFQLQNYTDFQDEKDFLSETIPGFEQILFSHLTFMSFAHYTRKTIIALTDNKEIIISGTYNDKPYCIQASEAKYNTFGATEAMLPTGHIKTQSETHYEYTKRILNLAITNSTKYISIYLKNEHYIPLNKQDKSRIETELDISSNPDFSLTARNFYKQLKSVIDIYIEQKSKEINPTTQEQSDCSFQARMQAAQSAAAAQNSTQQSQYMFNCQYEH